jgi:cell division protein FtsL
MTKLESSITDIETALASLKNTILDSKKYERVVDAEYNNFQKLYDKHYDLERKW